METTKLYYEDAYLREFDAAVLSCREEQGRYLVVLDRTAFYPEGGGQPADHGVLGGVAVTDVQERDGVVCHTCAGPLAVGSTVHGILDWQRRFDHMQQHSGEHIVSGMLCSAFHCDNVGFHMGTDVVTIDYNADIRWEQVLEVERQANRYIWEDHPCRVTFPSPAEPPCDAVQPAAFIDFSIAARILPLSKSTTRPSRLMTFVIMPIPFSIVT